MQQCNCNRWEPISTAPKDGTRVLTFDSYMESLFPECPGWGYKNNRVQQGWPDGIIGWQEHDNPTHWMPLPLPPASEGGV